MLIPFTCHHYLVMALLFMKIDVEALYKLTQEVVDQGILTNGVRVPQRPPSLPVQGSTVSPLQGPADVP